MNVGSDNGNNNTTTMAEISSLNPGDIKFLNATADHTFYLGYDFYSKDNPVFHTAGKYGFKEGKGILEFLARLFHNLNFKFSGTRRDEIHRN